MRRLWIPLVLASVLLIKIPPFYLIFPLKSSLLTSHTLARGFILLAFGVGAWWEYKGKVSLGKEAKTLLYLFLGYLAFQSFSVVSASNLTGFLQRYKDVVFPGILLFASLAAQIKRESVVRVFLAAGVVNFVYQMVMFFLPHFFRTWAGEFVYSGHLELVFINLERARIFIETYDEMAIPFIFFLFAREKDKKKRLLLVLLFLAIALPSFLSNFRSRVLILGLAFAASFLFLTGRKMAVKLGLLGAFVVFGAVAVVLSNALFGFSIVDRFALKDTQEDIQTLEGRVENIGISVDMGLARPLTGVGLGNYFDNLPSGKKVSISLFNWVRREAEIASTNPHDIFLQTLSETGIVSLIFMVGLLLYFSYLDIKILLKTKDKLRLAYIIAFWALFSYSIFNPTTTLGYNSLFWLLRGLII